MSKPHCLVLARNMGESIIIDDCIRVTVMPSNKSRQVKLHVEAPRAVAVDREELRRRKRGPVPVSAHDYAERARALSAARSGL